MWKQYVYCLKKENKQLESIEIKGFQAKINSEEILGITVR